jgi:hypothetical protein
MSKYIICQSFKKFHRAVFSTPHPKYSYVGGIRKESFPLQTLSLPVLFSFIQCLIKKSEKCGHFS